MKDKTFDRAKQLKELIDNLEELLSKIEDKSSSFKIMIKAGHTHNATHDLDKRLPEVAREGIHSIIHNTLNAELETLKAKYDAL